MSVQETEKYRQIKGRLKQEILAGMDYSVEISDDQIRELIDKRLLSREWNGKLTVHERSRLAKELFFSLRRLDILQELVDDPGVTEIMINGMDHIFIERDGRLYEWPGRFDSADKLQDVIQQIVAGCNRVVNEASPIVDARLPNGARVNVVLNPIALNGPAVTIRRFPDEPVTMEKLLRLGSITEEAGAFLEKLVRAGYNIMISGGTGSGKTTFLNALSEYIPADERIITIEDSAELQIKGISNLVRMETRNANVDGCRPVTIRDLIRTSLRMRPSRIIVGEVRGGEAFDMMQALNCGHDGSMCTGHANSTKDMLVRLENMILMGMELPLDAIRRQIASGVDVIVHLGRMRDKTRKVLEITEVTGYDAGEIRLSTLFAFEESEGSSQTLVKGKLMFRKELEHVEKLRAAGISLA